MAKQAAPKQTKPKTNKYGTILPNTKPLGDTISTSKTRTVSDGSNPKVAKGITVDRNQFVRKTKQGEIERGVTLTRRSASGVKGATTKMSRTSKK